MERKTENKKGSRQLLGKPIRTTPFSPTVVESTKGTFDKNINFRDFRRFRLKVHYCGQYANCRDMILKFAHTCMYSCGVNEARGPYAWGPYSLISDFMSVPSAVAAQNGVPPTELSATSAAEQQGERRSVRDMIHGHLRDVKTVDSVHSSDFS